MSVADEDEVDVGEKRVRTLTEKGRERYVDELKRLSSQVESVWSKVEDCMTDISAYGSDIKALRDLDTRVADLEKLYDEKRELFIEFLTRQNTAESLSEIDTNLPILKRCKSIIADYRRKIKLARIDAAETLSKSSVGSKESKTSGSILVKKRMKAEAQRVLLEFQRRELELEKKRASLYEEQAKVMAESERKRAEFEATYRVFDQERKAAEAEAEVRALENCGLDSRNVSPEPSVVAGSIRLPEKPVDRKKFTAEYISKHSSSSDTDDSTTTSNSTTQSEVRVKSVLNPEAKPFVSSADETVATNLTRFLLKKDLLFSRFTQFNDRPESFAAWKGSFLSITKELDVKPSEEIDLLVKYLGTESSKFAASIRAANASYPERGLERLWIRLEERYGSPELIESSLKAKLNSFPKLTNRDSKKLYDLVDILSEIESLKENPKYAVLLAHFDSSAGIFPIANKLPYSIQEKWTTRASGYKTRLDVPYPPFPYFVQFVQEMSRIRNDPGFQYDQTPPLRKAKKDTLTVLKSHQEERTSSVSLPTSRNFDRVSSTQASHVKAGICPIHNLPHPLTNCKIFLKKSVPDRKKYLRGVGMCFRCCDSAHFVKDCNSKLTCDVCGSKGHHTILHVEKTHGGERRSGDDKDSVEKPMTTICTKICPDGFRGKSCAKTVLVKVYPDGRPDLAVRLYALVDDQSDRTLARSRFFNHMGVDTPPEEYSLESCSGIVRASGRRANGLIVESLDGSCAMKLPTVIECDDIPNIRDEIPTPEVVACYPHLCDLVNVIPPLDPNADIELLIGRDLIEAHYVRDQRTGETSPYAQKLNLGWVIIGESCLSKTHAGVTVVVNKTHLLQNGRSSIMKPCDNYFAVKEGDSRDPTGDDVLFQRHVDDEKPGMSVEDREFIAEMDSECFRDVDGRWTAPLPFKPNRQTLPNNREQALKRTLSLFASFKRDPVKMDHALTFMEKVFANGHAEEAPPLQDGEECWFVPIFGVYHPKKPNQIRMVFDSSASFQGVSLNSVLLGGPDLANSLLGILLRFRKERIAVTGDIEQMFHSFRIRGDHRNFVRFIWFTDNDPSLPLRDYRMCVHIFGNAPSPAVATYCLRKCVQGSDVEPDVFDFVNRNFYVDDGLASFPTEEEALDMLLRTQTVLKREGKLRFHKFASNSQQVMDALPPEDRAKDLGDINLDLNSAPVQRSLGLAWNLQSDAFSYQFKPKDATLTKRVILSCLNSLYDPLGFIAPVILQGRFLFRDLITLSLGWDEEVPVDIQTRWRAWCSSLHHLSDLQISRTYTPFSLKESDRIEVHLFSDASEKAVSAVAYLKVWKGDDVHVGFVLGKSKLSPTHGHTIPRLELCAAVLSTELAAFITNQLDVTIDDVKFYTDSRVVLGYIHNRTRRFHTYVSNRVQRIHLRSSPQQWNFVSSGDNPADVGSRSALANELAHTMWLQGPDFMRAHESSLEEDPFPLVDPDDDSELRKETVLTKKTEVKTDILTNRFKKFSSWNSLIRALTVLRRYLLKLRKQPVPSDTQLRRSTELFVVRTCQQEMFGSEVANLAAGKPVTKGSSLRYLDPYLEDGLIRVGGRAHTGDALSGSRGPVIISGKSYIARLLVLHCHENVRHQGRHLTFVLLVIGLLARRDSLLLFCLRVLPAVSFVVSWRPKRWETYPM